MGKILFLSSRVDTGSLGARRSAPPPAAAAAVDFLGFVRVLLSGRLCFCVAAAVAAAAAGAVGAVEMTVVMQDVTGEGHAVMVEKKAAGEGDVAPTVLQASNYGVLVPAPRAVALALLLLLG